MAHSGSLGGKRSESPSGHQDYGNWSASSKDDACVWGKNEIIVDTKDTEAWPSIVDDGDRMSETALCKSVIASSSQQPGPSECAADSSARSGDAAGDSSAWMASKASSGVGGATAAWNPTSSTTSGASSLQQQASITATSAQNSAGNGSGWSSASHTNSSPSASAWQESARDHKGSGDAASWQSNGPSSLMAPGGWAQSGVNQGSKGMNIDTWTSGSHWNDAGDSSTALHEKSSGGDDWVKNQGNAQAQWNKSSGQWQGGSNAASSPATTPGSGSVSSNQSWTNASSSTADVGSAKPGPWSNQPVAKSLSGKPAQKAEVLDALQAQMMKAINTPENWGRTPIRQDTPWVDPDAVEGRKKEDSNTWNSMPNNGTGIWESLRKNTGGSGGPATWDDKKPVAYGLGPGGEDDPYVWNPTSKSKDNAMWDDVSKDSDSELPAGQNLWHGASNCGSPSWGGGSSTTRSRNGNATHSSRTASVSSGSGGDGITNGCVADGNADVKPSTWGTIEDDGPQASGNSGHPESGSQHWSAGPPGKALGGWNGPLSAGSSANPPQSLPKDWVSKADGGSKLWDQSNPPGGSTEWNGSNPSSGWAAGDTGKAGRAGGPWDPGHQEWPGPTANRRLRSDSDAHGWPEDAEIGEWSEQPRREHSWTSASQRRPMPNKHGANAAGLSSKMMNGGQPPATRQQMIQTLQEMGFSKESALKALLDNQMDLNRTIADLRSGASQQDSGQMPHILPSSMSEALSSSLNPHLPAMHPNTPLMNNAQGFPNAKSLSQGSSSRQHNHKAMPPQQQQQLPFAGPSRFPPQMVGHPLHQQQVLQNLQYLITHGLIPASAVSRPANSQHIETMLKLLSALQTLSSNTTLMQQQVQQSRGGNPLAMQQMIENIQHSRSRMDHIRMQLLAHSKLITQQQQQLQNQVADNTLFSELSSLTLNPASGNQPVQPQSRLYQWKQPPDSDLMSTNQPNRAPGSKPIHPSFSSPNLHGGLNIGNDSTWSTNSSTSNWPTSGSGKSSDGSRMESQSPSLDSQIPEFIPGQPWQGMSSQKVDEDPTITPSNAAKQYLSVNTAASNGLEQFGMGSGESWPGFNNFKPAPSAGSSWTTTSASPTGTFGVTDPWNGSSKVGMAPARPPPGLGAAGNSKNFAGLNRSVSWAPGPSAGWDRPASQWLVIRNLASQVDGAMLKSLCLQHGQLSNFYLNLHAGQALVQYNYAQDAIKAQKSLSSCVLSNSTLAAEFVGDEEVTRLIEHGSRQSQPARSGSMQWLNSSGTPQMPTWSSGGNAPSGAAVGSMWGGGGMTTLDGSAAAGAASNQSFLLPGDLLGTTDYSM